MEVACYLRVSTEKQNLDRQRTNTTDYATETFDVALGDLRYYRDKSTGTNTSRDGYEDMMGDLDSLDSIVVNSISRLARSIRDLDKTVDRAVSEGVEVHIISESMVINGDSDPYQTAMLRLLGVFAELEAEITQQRVREGIQQRMENEEYHHGPAPLGFRKNDGRLIESGNYDHVRVVLEMVRDGDLSKRKASTELDTSRRTIGRALDRKELYGL